MPHKFSFTNYIIKVLYAKYGHISNHFAFSFYTLSKSLYLIEKTIRSVEDILSKFQQKSSILGRFEEFLCHKLVDNIFPIILSLTQNLLIPIINIVMNRP